MEKVVWGPQLETAVPELDEQHKYLVEIINLMQSMIDHEVSRQDLEKVFNSLEQYARVHFAEEEEVLRKANYPDLERHIGHHRDFITRLEKIKAQEIKDPYVAFTSLLMFTREWFIYHLMREDMLYIHHLTQVKEEQETRIPEKKYNI